MFCEPACTEWSILGKAHCQRPHACSIVDTAAAVRQVIEDLQEECGKYGTVVTVAVPRPPDPANAKAAFGYGNYGKVCQRLASELHAASSTATHVASHTSVPTSVSYARRLCSESFAALHLHMRTGPCRQFPGCAHRLSEVCPVSDFFLPSVSVQAFVQFGDEDQAKVARDAIHGRLFAGVTVEVTFISAQDFTVAAS